MRECLTIRVAPGLFDSKSMLRAALAGQMKFAEAEPLLMEGYSGMKDREAQIPHAAKPRLAEALRRLIDLYTTWGKPAEAEKWRRESDRLEAEEGTLPN